MKTTISVCLSVLGLLMAGPQPAVAQDMSDFIAEAAGVPQIPAFLPDKYSVTRTQALPIDGVWMISTIKKKIRIEQGRAYAVDPWLHLLVLKVQPDMVVLQNFRRTGPGQYGADDLPLLGPATMRLNAQGNMDVTVQGKFGPVRYALIRLEPQFPEALTAEVTAATGQTVDIPTYAPSQPGNVAPLPGMPVSAPAPAPPAAPPVMAAPAPAPAPVPSAGGAPENCTPIGIDPDTGQTICAY